MSGLDVSLDDIRWRIANILYALRLARAISRDKWDVHVTWFWQRG